MFIPSALKLGVMRINLPPRSCGRQIFALIEMFREDLAHLAARNRHELMRCWEVVHRTWVGEAHLRHLLHRKETRWPGYYYRSDYPDLDDANWRVFVNSKFDAANNTWEMQTKPYKNIITSI